MQQGGTFSTHIWQHMFSAYLFQYHIKYVPVLLLAQLHSSSLTNCLVGHNLNLAEGEG